MYTLYRETEISTNVEIRIRGKHSKLDLLIIEKNNKLKREPVMKTGRQFQFQSSDDTSLFDW